MSKTTLKLGKLYSTNTTMNLYFYNLGLWKKLNPNSILLLIKVKKHANYPIAKVYSFVYDKHLCRCVVSHQDHKPMEQRLTEL